MEIMKWRGVLIIMYICMLCTMTNYTSGYRVNAYVALRDVLMLQRSMLHVSVSGLGQYCSSTSYEEMVRMYMYVYFIQHTNTTTTTTKVAMKGWYTVIYCIIVLYNVCSYALISDHQSWY